RSSQKLRELRVGEAFALQAAQAIGVERAERHAAQAALLAHEIVDLREEPGIDRGQLCHVRDREAGAERVGDVPNAVWAGALQLTLQGAGIVLGPEREHAVETASAGLEPTQRFLQRLLERAADRHDLADRFHLRRQSRVDVRKLLERET